ncbi:MAG: IS200/IS605 family transposase [Eubacteriales bacterium]|nr:IS200/IS605 family transposase [Eubacteriales bacterium]
MKRYERIPGAIYERNYVYQFHYHLIWTTKYRKPVFTTPELVQEMKDLLLEQAQISEITIEEMEVMPDHIHLLLSFKPKMAASTVVKCLKGHTAKLFFMKHPEIRDHEFWGGHLWSHSYYMGTLGNMSKDVVEQYIRNQYNKK